MNGVLVDSCVLLDLFTGDRRWGDWSERVLEELGRTNSLYINSIIYAEVSIGFNKIEEVESAVDAVGLKVLEMPREALFLAGKAFIEYRKRRGMKRSPLPDFSIGAHAAVARFGLVTRDLARYRTYFPGVRLIHP